MKRYKSSKFIEKAKEIIKKIVIYIVIAIISIWIYRMYSMIEVNKIGTTNNEIEIQRTTKVLEETNQNDKAIENLIEEANKSIVGISRIKNSGTSIFTKDSTSQLGLGTGIIVSENGYIVTNEHVSGERYNTCYVTLENGKTYNANVLWSDSSIDLSIIKINMKSLPYATLGDSNNIKVGQNVYAIGNPIGFQFQRTVTSGIISALNRTIKFEENGQEIYMSDLIQTDAKINPGNSGGPLINKTGQVIGINSVKVNSADGIGFAVPINIIKPIIDKYIKNDTFEEATIGIFAYDRAVIPYINGNLEFDSGIYVAQVIRNSPAEKMGIKEGDIISKIDGIELNKMSELKEYIYSKNPNDEITLSIQRNKEKNEVKIKLGKKERYKPKIDILLLDILNCKKSIKVIKLYKTYK